MSIRIVTQPDACRLNRDIFTFHLQVVVREAGMLVRKTVPSREPIQKTVFSDRTCSQQLMQRCCCLAPKLPNTHSDWDSLLSLSSHNYLCGSPHSEGRT